MTRNDEVKGDTGDQKQPRLNIAFISMGMLEALLIMTIIGLIFAGVLAVIGYLF